jgi:hypothetical protein
LFRISTLEFRRRDHISRCHAAAKCVIHLIVSGLLIPGRGQQAEVCEERHCDGEKAFMDTAGRQFTIYFRSM